MTLGLDDANLDLVWTEREMTDHRQKLGVRRNKYKFSSVKFHVQPHNRHVFRRPIKRLSLLRRKEGVFNANGKYSDSHVRKVVTVLDDNRISQDAYQCLRSVCMGHMPSLNQIKFQKKVMSHQLPVIGDAAVSYYVAHG